MCALIDTVREALSGAAAVLAGGGKRYFPMVDAGECKQIKTVYQEINCLDSCRRKA